MKALLALALTILIGPQFAAAQSAKPSPVTDALRQRLTGAAKNMTAGAEAMPADKYAFKPTPEQNSFAHIIIHTASFNTLVCSKISGVAAPDQPKLDDKDGKDKLVAALKSSFDFCSSALAKVDDSALNESLAIFPDRSMTRGAAVVMLASSWADHYSAQAMYLRLNGILPPTAQPAK